MPVLRKFQCSLSTLLEESVCILDAAEEEIAQAVMKRRLSEGFVFETRDLSNGLTGRIAGASRSGGGQSLTGEQQEKFIAAVDLMDSAKQTARCAFPENPAKVKDEFLGTHQRPARFADVLQALRTVRDACRNAANAPGLRSKGWLPDDTEQLSTAVDVLEKSGGNQEHHVPIRIVGNDARNTAANDLYERLLAIQNAANIEWPERKEANREIRARFRFETFPAGPGVPEPRRNPHAPDAENGGTSSEFPVQPRSSRRRSVQYGSWRSQPS